MRSHMLMKWAVTPFVVSSIVFYSVNANAIDFVECYLNAGDYTYITNSAKMADLQKTMDAIHSKEVMVILISAMILLIASALLIHKVSYISESVATINNKHETNRSFFKHLSIYIVGMVVLWLGVYNLYNKPAQVAADDVQDKIDLLKVEQEAVNLISNDVKYNCSANSNATLNRIGDKERSYYKINPNQVK